MNATDAIRARREALKLSMRAAAQLAGISPTAWSDLEAGKNEPTTTTQRKIAHALGWPIDWYDLALAGEPIEPVSQLDEVAELRQQVLRLAAQVAELTRGALAMGATIDQTATPTAQAGDR